MSKLRVSPSPHFKSGITTQRIMLDVIFALMPAVIASCLIFGPRALIIYAVSCGSCVICEYFSRKIMKRTSTISDLSAIVTGVLLAMNLPVSINPLIVMFGSMVAIIVVKQMFGGIGQNFVNPALTARIILLSSFPSKMTTWTEPFAYLNGNIDSVSSATPLAMADAKLDYFNMFMGIRGGCLGETCVAALLLGGIYLIARRVISPVIPLTYISTVAIFSLVLGQAPIYQIMSGGLMLGAFFMATDYATSPINPLGKLVFALGCGIITVVIRQFGSLPEGVSFAIILMNILVSHIENLTMTKPFGFVRTKKEASK
ncbi:MAG: RnfABCDGE type electron transport complex subunit D [Clostridia bacterium]|nr:RnfABCDGE type electron transport complex subunit D [Clostridia bacterium]